MNRPDQTVSTGEVNQPPALDEDEEPTALGAAATLPAARSRQERRHQRAQRGTMRTGLEPVQPSDGGKNDEEEIVSVFEPHTASLPNLRHYLRAIWGRRRFMDALARSDIKGARSSTVLASIWGLLDPLFQSAIFFFLFAVIRGGSSSGGSRPLSFLPILIGGVFLFAQSTAALSQGGRSVRRGANLMLNSSFPTAILPIGAVYQGVLRFVPTAVVYVGIYAIAGPPPQRGLLILPLLFAIQTIMSVGIALLTATLVIFWQDVENSLRYVTRLLFFTTPVIYPAAILPDSVYPWIAIQPFFSLFASYQKVLGGGTADATFVLAAACWAVVLLLLGGWLFLRYERAMASRL